MTWLRHAGPQASGAGPGGGAAVLAGPGAAPARSARRVNGVLTAVRGMVVHAAETGQAPGDLVPLLYEVADDRDLPGQARDGDGRMSWRLRARHRLREPETRVDRASDEEIVALLAACLSARDRLIVLLMARAGLRCGELCGLRRCDVHLLADSRPLGCEVARAHLHVTRREDNPNGAWAKSRRQRAVPLDFLVVQAFDTYELERAGIPAGCRERLRCWSTCSAGRSAPRCGPAPSVSWSLRPAGAPGWTGTSRRTMLRHACGSNLLDAGGALDEAQDILGHMHPSSTQVYLHPDPARLREAVDRVPSPRTVMP